MTWGEVTEDGQRSAVLRKSLLDVNSHRKMPVGLLVTPGQQEGAGAGWGSLSEGFLVDTARARSSHPSPVPSQLCPCRLRPPQTPRETENRERKGMGAGMNGEGWGRMESGLFSPLFPQLSLSREGNEDERAALAARRGGQTRSCCRDDPGSAPGPASAGREGSVGTDTPRFLRARPSPGPAREFCGCQSLARDGSGDPTANTDQTFPPSVLLLGLGNRLRTDRERPLGFPLQPVRSSVR